MKKNLILAIFIFCFNSVEANNRFNKDAIDASNQIFNAYTYSLHHIYQKYINQEIYMHENNAEDILAWDSIPLINDSELQIAIFGNGTVMLDGKLMGLESSRRVFKMLSLIHKEREKNNEK